MWTVRYFLLLLVVLGIAGCNTTIYPESNGLYSSTTTSSAQHPAESSALKDTENYCKKIGKRLVVVNHGTTYNGTTMGNKIAGAIVGGIIGIPNPAVSGSDYVVKTRFRCQ